MGENKSKTTKRAIPTPNIPEPMPSGLAFMFTKISPEQKMYMWNIFTLIFVLQNEDERENVPHVHLLFRADLGEHEGKTRRHGFRDIWGRNRPFGGLAFILAH